MKITIFNGSPKGRNSNTNVIAEAFLNGAASVGSEIQNVFLIDKKLHFCKGCFSCWFKTPGQCVLNDDMEDLLTLYKQSDVVCFATPIYMWNMTACMKNFLDRLIPVKSPHIEENNGNFDMTNASKMPDVVIISNAGFPGENNFHIMKEVMKAANPILEIYRNCGMALRMNNEHIQRKVKSYLVFVEQAGAQIASGLSVTDAVLSGLNAELFPTDEYVRIIGG
ncbi:flavodoxin family protein [Synergistales bacterium]|nr:flavodoxin family protein [Synergistales bacterium]